MTSIRANSINTTSHFLGEYGFSPEDPFSQREAAMNSAETNKA